MQEFIINVLDTVIYPSGLPTISRTIAFNSNIHCPNDHSDRFRFGGVAVRVK